MSDSYTKKCTCGMTITFYRTPNDNWIPTEPGLQSVYDPHTGEVYRGFTPHHINCPHSEQHQRNRRKKPSDASHPPQETAAETERIKIIHRILETPDRKERGSRLK